MKFIKNTIFLRFLIILIIFTLDRVSKTYIINLFNETQFDEIYLLSFINIYFIWNEGIAFGLFSFDKDYLYNILTIIIFLIIILKDKLYCI